MLHGPRVPCVDDFLSLKLRHVPRNALFWLHPLCLLEPLEECLTGITIRHQSALGILQCPFNIHTSRPFVIMIREVTSSPMLLSLKETPPHLASLILRGRQPYFCSFLSGL